MEWFLESDYRKNSLKIIVSGLIDVIDKLKSQIQEISWYDGLWLLEETEPIYGLAFIAFQNYIYNTINDVKSSRFIEDRKYYEIYKEDRQIELIVHLANYYKHRNDNLNERTEKGLVEFKLLPIDEEDQLENSPIFKGLELLSPNWDLNMLVDIVSNWREKLLNELNSEISE